MATSTTRSTPSTLLRPSLDPADPDAIDLPLGSYVVEHLFNRIEEVDPFADNVKPATSYFLWALANHPVRALSTLGAHLGLVLAVLRRSKGLAREERLARQAAYEREVVRPHHLATARSSATGTKPTRAGPAAPGPVRTSPAMAPVAHRSSRQGAVLAAPSGRAARPSSVFLHPTRSPTPRRRRPARLRLVTPVPVPDRRTRRAPPVVHSSPAARAG